MPAIRTAIAWVLTFVEGDGADRWEYLDSVGGSAQLLRSVSGLMGRQRVVKSGDETRYHLRLEMPGQFCKLVQQLPLCEYLDSEGFRITRIDVCLDDYLRRVPFSAVKSAGDEGHYRLVESFESIESAVLTGDRPIGTCYFGRSDKRIRFYDAEFMHGFPADRWELQLRNDLARSAFDLFRQDPDCLASLVVGAVDFGIPGNHYRKFARFPWWQSLIDDSGSASRVSGGRYVPDLSRTVKWLDTSVAPTLAVLRSGLGLNFQQFLTDLCDSGYDRLKPYHHQWIDAIRVSEVNVHDLLSREVS
ncbi:replication initiation factor domain-containing protein [Pannus brasiliensis CCIBt3594]|uniref:Replication initiation factor domain-containing protein n=1 Tax=Pannus brasiliensis CCIBt3594 TaxID=1427578 RepID=A0AAW9QXL4_9CHRO